MKEKNGSPSVLRDLTAVAGLYRNVVWMFGQRMQRGPDWQERLFDEAIRREAVEEMRQREVVASRRN
jgi:hypothetical protein